MSGRFNTINGSQLMAIITVILTILISATGIFTSLKHSESITAPEPQNGYISISKGSELFKSISMIDQYRNETVELKNTLNNLKMSSTLSPENIRIEELESKIKKLQNNLDNINSIIIASPEKALSLPMMRKDIDATDKSMKFLSEYTENQFERFYNLFLWMCGTLILGVAGLGLSLFLSNKSNSN